MDSNTRTIDITPAGCTTPEGNARVTKALDEFNGSAHTVANLAASMMDARRNGTLTSEDLDELQEAIEARRNAQESFLRAVAGAPKTAAERAAEERTRIGNTPTCDECGEQHSQDTECDPTTLCPFCETRHELDADGYLPPHTGADGQPCINARTA